MFNSDLNVELCWWWANMLISHNYKYATGRGGNTTRGKTKGTNPPPKKILQNKFKMGELH